MNWTKIFVNVLLTFIGGFGAVYATTQDVNAGLAAGLTAVASNQVGLHQKQPLK